MTISKDTRSNLTVLAAVRFSYQQIVNELRVKYAKKGWIMFSKYDVYTTVRSLCTVILIRMFRPTLDTSMIKQNFNRPKRNLRR